MLHRCSGVGVFAGMRESGVMLFDHQAPRNKPCSTEPSGKSLSQCLVLCLWMGRIVKQQHLERNGPAYQLTWQVSYIVEERRLQNAILVEKVLK